MMGKKAVICLVVLSCLWVWGNMTLAAAAEADTTRLINLLKSKNILTQEEADSLLRELNSSAQKEKEEMKAAAGKGDFLPPALRGFRFSTLIFAEWNNTKPDDSPSTNQFRLNRTYLTFMKEINDWLGMSATADLTSNAEPGGDGWELRLKYAYANLNLYGTTSYLGLIPTPSDAYDSSIWPYRVQDNNLLDGQGIESTADFGVANQGVFGGYMDEQYLKFATKPFAGKWGGYFVGLYNGAGYNNGENNNNKVVAGLIYVRPLPAVPILKGLQVAYFGTYGQSNSTFAPGQGVTTDYPDWRVNVAQISLQHEYFTVMGQYYWGKGTFTSTDDHDRNAYLVDAFLRIPTLEKLRAFGKWYYYDANTDGANDSYRTYVGGLSYDVANEFMPFVAFERRVFESARAGKDFDKYQIGFQLKF